MRLPVWKYRFNGNPTPGPGRAREVEFQMFQDVQSWMVQGAGALVAKPLQSYATQWQTIANVPVPTGDSGVMTGGIYHQPLMNSSPDVAG